MPSPRAKEVLSELLKQDFGVPHDHGCLHSYDAVLSGRLADLRSQGQSSFLSLEETPGGKWLESQLSNAYKAGTPYPENDRQFLWDEASRAYVRGLKGEVSAFVDWNRPGGTFQRIECAELLKNENITAVNGIPQEELQERFLHGIEVDSPGMSRVFVQSGGLAEELNAERTWREASIDSQKAHEARDAAQSQSIAQRILDNLERKEQERTRSLDRSKSQEHDR